MNTKQLILFLGLALLIALALLVGLRASATPALANSNPCSSVQGDPPIDDPEPTAIGTVTLAGSGAGVENASVKLYRCQSGTGSLVATTTTDADGDYTFEGFTPGRYYYVQVDLSGPLEGRQPAQGTQNPSQAIGVGPSMSVNFSFQ